MRPLRLSYKLKALIALLVISASSLTAIYAADDDDTVVFDPEEVPFEEFVAEPPVPKRQNKAIAEYMRNEAIKLAKLNYDVETMRHGQVVIVNIPTDLLFAPNDTVLLPTAYSQLQNILAYTSVPDRYKIIFKLHTDDTGSELYLYNLSVSRMNAVYDFFDANAIASDDIFGYPVGNEEPRTDNSSREHRADNRRLELFIIPDRGLINQMKNR